MIAEPTTGASAKLVRALSDSSTALQPGQRLDRYELICPITKGGMAQVWVARLHGKHGFEKLVALKTILPEFADDARFQAMFLDEARIACAIEHPNVAQTLDLGEETGVLYIAMEWVDGEALSKLQRAVGSPMPLAIALRILADACSGLHAAHELRGRDGLLLNVVHRDVSPQNVMVTIQGVSKVIDFGIAKATNRQSEATNTGVMKGKPQYMAPEQALGLPVDRGADIWAIGAMLYQMITGYAPYQGDNQLALLHRLTSGQPYAPLGPEVPQVVSTIVARCLQHQSADRYTTAADLQQDLEHAIEVIGRPASAKHVGAYLQKHLADRLRVRRDAIALGVRAAEERRELSVRLDISVAELATTPTHLRPQVGIANAELEVPSQASALSLDRRPGSQGNRRLLFIAAGAVAVLGLLAALAVVGRLPRSAPSPAATPATATAAPLGTASTASTSEPAIIQDPAPSASAPKGVSPTKSSHPTPAAMPPVAASTPAKQKSNVSKPGDDLGF